MNRYENMKIFISIYLLLSLFSCSSSVISKDRGIAQSKGDSIFSFEYPNNSNSDLYYTFSEDIVFKVTLEHLTLPGGVKDFNMLYLGDSDFELSLKYNGFLVSDFIISSNPKDKTHTLDESIILKTKKDNETAVSRKKKAINTLIKSTSFQRYSQNREIRGPKICLYERSLISKSLIANRVREPLGCLYLVERLKEMLAENKNEKEIVVTFPLPNRKKRGVHVPFSQVYDKELLLETKYRIEILSNTK